MKEAHFEWLESNIPEKLVEVVHDTIRRAVKAGDDTERLVCSGMICAMVETMIATGVMDTETVKDYVFAVYRKELSEEGRPE